MNTPLFDITKVNTPCYVIEQDYIRKNCEILKQVCDNTGCRILLAQKAFSAYSTYPLISQYLNGTTASGLHEAILGHDKFGGETHVFSPAYTEEDIKELIRYADHFVFNSIRQFNKFKEYMVGKAVLIRVNPRFSTQEGHEIYDPCAPLSRLGSTISSFEKDVREFGLDGIDGIHFHTLCEQNSDDLYKTAMEVERQFGKYLKYFSEINFGGGHHITRDDYDIPLLEKTINHFKDKYGLTVYLEPGEAVALNDGFAITTGLDIIEGSINNEQDIAIMDISAACHMPDVLEMPYRPVILDSRFNKAGEKGEYRYHYRLGSNTCLAGDITGDYSFKEPLKPGDRLVLCDMAIYSMVKNNTFNGMKLPDIYLNQKGRTERIKTFGYEDFLSRL